MLFSAPGPPRTPGPQQGIFVSLTVGCSCLLWHNPDQARIPGWPEHWNTVVALPGAPLRGESVQRWGERLSADPRGGGHHHQTQPRPARTHLCLRRILDHRRCHTSAPLPGATFSRRLSFSKVSLTPCSPHPRKASPTSLFLSPAPSLVAFPWSCAVSPQRPFEGSQPIRSCRPHPLSPLSQGYGKRPGDTRTLQRGSCHSYVPWACSLTPGPLCPGRCCCFS